MIAILLAFPFFGFLAILQSAVLSPALLLYGTTDLALLGVAAWAIRPLVRTAWHWAVIGGVVMGLFSGLPFGTHLSAYLVTAGLVIYFRRRVWRFPILAMATAVFVGTLFEHSLAYLLLVVTGTPILLGQAFSLVIMPSLFLNMLLVVPFYVFLGALAGRLYPAELEG